MTPRAFARLGTSLLALGLGVVPGRVHAADHELCTEYATQALEQYRRAQELGCPGLNYPVAPDRSAMVVRHPTGGCDSFLGVPTDTNESGVDRFFFNGRPGGELSIISAEFAQLDPNVSEIDFLAKWGSGVVMAVATGGPVGLLKHLLTQALEGGLRALGGDSGAYGIDPDKPDWLDAGDPRAAVSWTNTCVGLYENQPLEYSVRFVVSGSRHLLYPNR